ncbi:hypothetical protein BH09ACT8_BH09ACT8_30370 [soil metagenome]
MADDHRLLGVLTADAAAAILEGEATEDAERQGGSEPLEVPYLRASPLILWRKRIVWLLVLFVAEAYTGTVLRAFEDTHGDPAHEKAGWREHHPALPTVTYTS